MKITVVCYGAMRDYLPVDADGNRATLDLPEGATVVEVAARLGAPERLIHAVLVNGERAALAKEINEGEEVTLMPPFAGG